VTFSVFIHTYKYAMPDKTIDIVNFFLYILINLSVPSRGKTLITPEGRKIVMGLEVGL
jgi:hypothetical protein